MDSQPKIDNERPIEVPIEEPKVADSSSEKSIDEKHVDTRFIAQQLKISEDQVVSAIKLLDEENTIPFIARYRRDQTRGLYESQLRRIKEHLNRARAINERKAVIRKSIDSQEALTVKIAAKIDAAKTSRELEDVYLPFKPQKQSQAELARQRGLEPLARDLLEATITGEDLPSRAEQFVRVDKGLESIEDVIEGVHHLLVDSFCQNVEVRRELRHLIGSHGMLVSKSVESAKEKEPAKEEPAAKETAKAKDSAADSNSEQKLEPTQKEISAESTSMPDAKPAVTAAPEISTESVTSESVTSESKSTSSPEATPATGEESSPNEAQSPSVEISTIEAIKAPEIVPVQGSSNSPESSAEQESAVQHASAVETGPPKAPVAEGNLKPVARTKKKKTKKKKPSAKDAAFAEFANFNESLKKIPPHRILAINRGERADKLKVSIENKKLSIDKIVADKMVPKDHPFEDVLNKAARDSLTKMIMPSVIREIRRDLTESAEMHAGRVFSKNLRQLLIQRPVAPQRILAIDPGFRTGCKVAVIDEMGKPLATGRFFIVGKQERTVEGREVLTRLVNEHKVTLIAIGNGAGCRATEQLVSDLLSSDLKETTTKYMIVNQAGASAYSTCELAREELPDHDPIFRSAISIGRRLLDPLSELVKINPSNIGVGMYQHDVKAKHLQDSLDDEVESSVNFVGVDLNSASNALLKYVAGLNQMTARRIVEYRSEKGPFKNLQELKQVQGVGEKTFVQCAGFLRVFDGEEPLDATPIHPESYSIAEKILEKVGTNAKGLIDAANQYSQQLQTLEPNKETPRSSWQDIRVKLRNLDLQKTADELGVGKLLVDDLIRCLMRPSRDPRHDFQSPVQRRTIMSVDDLEINKELRGQVVNVVDFGVFVDIGLGTSSLIHISQLSEKFIHDLHLAYSVGDILTVWVTEIDKPKKQVKLTAVRPTALPSNRPPRTNTRRYEGKRYEGKPKGKNFRKSSEPRSHRPAKPKAPPPPITQEMVEGKKPMRSFSDLAQFFDKNPGDTKKK